MIVTVALLVSAQVTFGSDDLWATQSEGSSAVNNLALSPDGHFLAYVANGEIVIASTVGPTVARIPTQACNHVAIANEGKVVACDEARYVDGARDTTDDPTPRATPEHGLAAASAQFGRSDEWLARTLDGKWRVRREGKRVLLLGGATRVVLEPDVSRALTSSTTVWARIARDGATLAVGFGDGANLYRTRDGALLAHVGDGLRLFDMMFSADGALAAYTAPAGLVVLDARTGKERAFVKTAADGSGRSAISGDGRMVALTAARDVTLLSTSSPAYPATPLGLPRESRALALDRDGTLLAHADAEGAIRLFRLSTSGARRLVDELVLERIPGPATADLSPDGTQLEVTAEDATRIYDARTGDALGMGRGPHTIARTSPYPKRDSELTAAERPRLLDELPGAQVLDIDRTHGRVLIGMDTVYVVDLATQKAQQLAEQGTARFSGDGRVVVVPTFRADHALVFDPATAREERVPVLFGARLVWVRGPHVLVRRAGRLQLLTLPPAAR